MNRGFSGHTHTEETRRKIGVATRSRKDNFDFAGNFRAWREQNPEIAHKAFRQAGLKTSHQPGHVERLLTNIRKWEEEHPEQAHRNAVTRGFKVAHFSRLCHVKKANPRCPFCYPDGTEVKS